MRSTTVGWLTSMLRVLPVTADHTWLNSPRPEPRDSITHPIAPTDSTPRNIPRMRASPTSALDRTGFAERGPASGSCGMSQGYHQADGDRRPTNHDCSLVARTGTREHQSKSGQLPHSDHQAAAAP